MLANFEQRYFENEIKVWQGVYCDLQNIIHWHQEYELIYIKKGSAKIGVNSNSYSAKAGDLVICTGGDMHYINSIEIALKPTYKNTKYYISKQKHLDSLNYLTSYCNEFEEILTNIPNNKTAID